MYEGIALFKLNKRLAPGNEREARMLRGSWAKEREGRRFSNKKFLVLRETGENEQSERACRVLHVGKIIAHVVRSRRLMFEARSLISLSV